MRQLRDVLEEFRRRRAVAEQEGQLAPVALIYGSVLESLEEVPLGTPARKGAPLGLIDVDETARRLGVDRTWVYRHLKELPFAVRLPGKALRFDPVGLEKYIHRHAA